MNKSKRTGWFTGNYRTGWFTGNYRKLEIPGISLLRSAWNEAFIYMGSVESVVDKLKIWNKCDEVAKLYLLARAVHLVYFGDEVANVAYPQPSFAGARELVNIRAILLGSKEKSIIKDMEEKEAATSGGGSACAGKARPSGAGSSSA